MFVLEKFVQYCFIHDIILYGKKLSTAHFIWLWSSGVLVLGCRILVRSVSLYLLRSCLHLSRKIYQPGPYIRRDSVEPCK